MDDGKPTILMVSKAAEGHISEADAQWVRDAINAYKSDRQFEVEKQLHLANIDQANTKAELAEYQASHALMAAQFRIMQAEKEHGWREADRWRARAEKTEARFAQPDFGDMH